MGGEGRGGEQMNGESVLQTLAQDQVCRMPPAVDKEVST